MRIKAILALGLAWGAALASAACLNFRPALEAPDFQVESILFCRTVASDGELLTAVEVRDEFGPEDESVVCFVRLKRVSADIWLRWKWYSPEGGLARDSGRVAVATAGNYLETVTAFDRFDLGPDPAARRAGTWTVAFFMGDDLASRRTFRLLPTLNKVGWTTLCRRDNFQIAADFPN
jgi:hypothetical protein